MIKFTPLIFILFLLSACGGGSSSDSPAPAPAPAPNTAPTMSGTFTSDAKAMQKTVVVFDIADAENDSLTLAITEQPQWLSFELSNNNQVTITIEPDFFDIDNYELALSLSDGKASTEYKFIVDVIDNPAQWQHVDMTEQELIGTWSTDENGGLSLTFFENDKGLYFSDNKLVPHSWELDGTIVVDIQQPGCNSSCGIIDFMEVALLAQEGDKLRVEIDIEDGVRQYVNLTKEQSNEFIYENFINIPQAAYNTLSVVKVDDGIANIGVTVEDISLGDTSYGSFFTIEGNLIDKSGHFDISLTSSNKLLDGKTGSFYNFDTNQEEELMFDVIVDNVELQSISSGFVIVKVLYHAELLTDIEPSKYNNYNNLGHSLEPKYTYDVLNGISENNEVNLNLNTSYAARLLPIVSTNIDGVDYRGGASVFKFVSDKDGETKLKVAGENSSITQNFSWSKDGGILTVTIDGNTRAHQFYTLPNGMLGLSLTFEEDGTETRTSIYEFSEVTENNLNAEKYIGQFETQYQSFFGNLSYSDMKIGANGRGDNSYFGGDELKDFWKFEEDGSISFINSYDCPNAYSSALDFDACYAEAKTNMLNSFGFAIRSYKLLSVIDDTYIFQYGYRAKYAEEDWAYESIRRFKKVAE